ncbi:DeoR/GlpR family DNA-binding transcription regulator [Marinomonas mediterranea]|uniref:DeoR/GlpR family DNA-binding transcription regulator n=1 Tax=Marinomonas mediterranea TaxID=119864 RepID=UPI0023497834|nr:DeoR/GlpR family DNA-binding transcription regulator [Marinomonas mediterranea]WCN08936.1 DeoR family transcriptional regulator [Marinomonas mediterranea]
MNHRQRDIVKWINQNGRHSITALAAVFEVSVQTIRSDIRLLSERGLVLRNHGEVVPFPNRENISFDQRRIHNMQGKLRIAELALSKINDYQSIFLGSGSTVAEVAKALEIKKELHVMTSNLHAARVLSDHTTGELTIAGGKIRKRDQDVIGADAVNFFQKYRADVGIFSVSAIDKQGMLFDFTDDDISALEVLVNNCHYRILVIDSTKFEKESRCVWGRLSDINCLITDRAPAQYLLSKIRAFGVEVLF